MPSQGARRYPPPRRLRPLVPPKIESARAAASGELIANPADTAAWLRFSESLIAEGRSQEAVEGLRLAVRAMPANADLWVALGSALAAHANGIITPAARLAFGRASAADPAHPAPPYYVGLAYLQAGEPAQALAAWRALEARTPLQAPWRTDLERKIDAAEAMAAASAG